MEEAEILELYRLSYSDLVLASGLENALSLSSPEDRKKCQSTSRDVMEALGPTGPGLLCITDVPGAAVLRRQLLPLARKLTLLDRDTRKRILKENHLGSDVPLKHPERNVSSFSMQLKYAQSSESAQDKPCLGKIFCPNPSGGSSDVVANLDLQEDDFKNLGVAFKELGFRMMELGLRIARVCDREMGGWELEDCLLESCTAKGRLIHYHSAADRLRLREAERISNKKGYGNGSEQEGNGKKETGSRGIHFNLWQQWHYDYGIFTVLTDPMFLSSSSMSPAAEDQCASPSEHTYLQIYHPSKNKVYMVKTPPDSFIVQIGESADILSKGKLRSTLHCVCRPEKLENMSRETFVVFLQPAWSKSFCVSDYSMLDSQQTELTVPSNSVDRNELRQGIQKIVPPLLSRLKDGMTFAEFSRLTTMQYYGKKGLQSNKTTIRSDLVRQVKDC